MAGEDRFGLLSHIFPQGKGSAFNGFLYPFPAECFKKYLGQPIHVAWIPLMSPLRAYV